MKRTNPAALGTTAFLVITTCALLFVPSETAAQDPAAPPGSSARWLSCERWVMLHWIPYDERRLFRILRITRDEAQAWIADDRHHTFAQLVRRRRLEPRSVARRLVGAWARELDAERRAALEERALRTLTQGHLAQHVFFHVRHHPEVGAQAPRVFDTSPMHYFFLRHSGYSPAEIGAIHGRSRTAIARAIARLWRRTARTGAQRHETPPQQARRFAQHQVDDLQAYLDSRIAPKRPGPPPARPRAETPEPRMRLLCTIFAGRYRAAHAVNYGADAPPGLAD